MSGKWTEVRIEIYKTNLDQYTKSRKTTQVEQYGLYPDRIPGAEIRTVISLQKAVYGRIFTVYVVVYGLYNDRIVRPGQLDSTELFLSKDKSSCKENNLPRELAGSHQKKSGQYPVFS
jgi:hypothetical protein